MVMVQLGEAFVEMEATVDGSIDIRPLSDAQCIQLASEAPIELYTLKGTRRPKLEAMLTDHDRAKILRQLSDW